MKTENIKNLYAVTPELHERISQTLQQLDSSSVERYRKQRSIRRITLAFATVALLAAFTTAAYATQFFGLLIKEVGKYGVDMRVIAEVTPDSATEKRYAKPNPTYLPEGCCQLNGTDNEDDLILNPEGVTSYNPNGNYTYTDTDEIWVHFHICEADKFHEAARYIVDRFEKEYNGHKVVFLTRQFTDNGDQDYYAIKYFEDWDYVVDCYYSNMPELMKIMEGLELQEAEDHVEPPTLDLSDDPTAGYTVSLESEKREYQISEAFTWSCQTVNAATYDYTDGVYEITVTSVKEHDGVKGLDKSKLLAPEDEEWYSRYFNADGSLKTPYTRTRDNYGSDYGVDSLGHVEETEMNRHFYLITIEVKTIDDRYGGFNGQFMTDSRDSGAIYYDKRNENGVDIYTVGIIADEDVLDDLALSLHSQEITIDDNKETAVRKDIDTVIPLSVDR